MSMYIELSALSIDNVINLLKTNPDLASNCKLERFSIVELRKFAEEYPDVKDLNRVDIISKVLEYKSREINKRVYPIILNRFPDSSDLYAVSLQPNVTTAPPIAKSYAIPKHKYPLGIKPDGIGLSTANPMPLIKDEMQLAKFIDSQHNMPNDELIKLVVTKAVDFKYIQIAKLETFTLEQWRTLIDFDSSISYKDLLFRNCNSTITPGI